MISKKTDQTAAAAAAPTTDATTTAKPAGGRESPAAARPAPVRTKDRNPADRAQWKRDRAKALGHAR